MMMVINVERIAHVCHDANRALQLETNDPAPSPPWEDAPAWQRESAVLGVQEALKGATPEQLHESWWYAKDQAGWVFGLVKDEFAKTHPCCRPYAELPWEQRIKDTLFQAIVAALR